MSDIYFILNLLQDLNILRPLAYLICDDLDLKVKFILTNGFIKRDRNKLYINELNKMQNQISIDIIKSPTALVLYNLFNDSPRGLLVSASESYLYAHYETNEILQLAGNNIRTITIQHGFECVGFLTSINHKRVYGNYIGFSADIICGWLPISLQRELLNTSKNRYLATGPSSSINSTSKRKLLPISNIKIPPIGTGIICENIHSVRFSNSSSSRQFIDIFYDLAKLLEKQDKYLALRPHPGGQFKKTISTNKNLPKNVIIDNNLSFNVEWSSYEFGLSSPSSVLFDMFFSNIPVCLWIDSEDSVDSSLLNSFPKLTSIEQIYTFCMEPSKFKIHKKSQSLTSLTKLRQQSKLQFINLFRNLLNE